MAKAVLACTKSLGLFRTERICDVVDADGHRHQFFTDECNCAPFGVVVTVLEVSENRKLSLVRLPDIDGGACAVVRSSDLSEVSP